MSGRLWTAIALASCACLSACDNRPDPSALDDLNVQTGAPTPSPAETATGNEDSMTAIDLPDEGQSLTGRYEGDFGGNPGEVDISPPRWVSYFNQRFYAASVSVSRQDGCTGDVSGSGFERDGVLLISPSSEDEGDSCTIRISRRGNRLLVSESDCEAYRGASCSFDGTLDKVSGLSRLDRPSADDPKIGRAIERD